MPLPFHQPAADANPRPDEVRREIDQTLRELAALAAGEHAPAQFYDELLARVVRVTGARGAAVWIVGAGDAVHLLRHHSLEQALGGVRRPAIDRERARLNGLLAGQAVDDGRSLSFVARIAPANKLWGVVAVYFAAKAMPAREGLQKFVEAVAESATEYQARRELRHWNQDRDALTRLHDLTLSLHRPWSRQEVLAEVASEGRRFLDCDRVAVAIRYGRGYRVAAASGAATLNRRSAELQTLEQLVAAAMRLGQPLYYEEPAKDSSQPSFNQPDSSQQRPPQIERPLDAYLDESATRRLVIVPLDSRKQGKHRPPAALIVEQMSDRPLDASSQSVWLLAEHATVAVDRATRVARLPIIGPMLGVDSLRQTITRRWAPRGLIALALVAAVVATLLLVQVDYSVRVQGELMPAVRRNVFAPVDGVVTQLYVKHGEQVAAGQPLAKLRSPDLDIELTRVRGAIAAAKQELAAAQTARLEALASPDGARSQGQLAGEINFIEQKLEALDEERQLIEDEQGQLQVESPIAGTVVSWDLRHKLNARPVARGQRLLTVARLDQTWRVRLHAPDRQAGPILDAHAASPEGLPVRLVTSGKPDEVIEIQATRFHLASEPDLTLSENGLQFEAELTPGTAGFSTLDLRPGAEVIGRVECGRRSLAYLWLGDLYEELRRWFF